MKIVHIIRMILLGISMVGYIFLLTKKMRMEFAVGFTFAAITGCLFLAGILNLLPETAVLIFLGGVICFVLGIRARILLKNLFSFGSLFLLVGGIGLFYILYGSKFVNQDIFDHWGTVIQVLIRYNRFPNYLDKQIVHKTYVPGTACWIYYWMFISGTRAEYIQIYAQNFLFLGMSVSLFAVIRNRIGKLLTAAVIVMLLCGNQELFSIQVDNILVIAALSAVSFSLYYRDDPGKKYAWLAAWCVFLTAVKSSGMLFIFFILLLVLPQIGWKKTGFPACITGLAFLLWSKHTELVFTDAAKSKHTVSLANYRSVLEAKSRDDILNICRMFMEREFSDGNRFKYLLILAILLIIIGFIFRFREKGLLRRLCCYSVCFYCIHEIGLMIVYIISIPLSEALRLSHYARYHNTAILFSAGILLIAVQIMLNDLLFSGKVLSAAVVIVCGLLFILGIDPKVKYLRRQDPASYKERDFYDQMISRVHVPDRSRIMNFTGDGEDPHNYYNALARYYFAPDRIVHVTPEKFTSWENFDYVFVLTDSEEALRFIRESDLPDQLTVVMK